jgi:hypothetical protein
LRVASVPPEREPKTSPERIRSTRPQLNEKKASKISAAKKGRGIPFIKIIFLPSAFKTKIDYKRGEESWQKMRGGLRAKKLRQRLDFGRLSTGIALIIAPFKVLLKFS